MSLSLLTALALGAAPAPAGTHAYTIQDQVAMHRLSSPRASPNGKEIAFVLSSTDLDANKLRQDLWVAQTDGSGARALTNNTPASETSPVWSRDGKTLYYLSDEGGSSQIWKLAVDGKSAPQQVTKLPVEVDAFKLSPDGRWFAAALSVFPECGTLQCTTDRLKATSQQKATGRVYDELLLRHWDQWADGRRNHVFAVAVDGKGEPRDLMKGMKADSPSKPFGDDSEYTFTPDSKGVVFTARDAGRTEAWSTDLDLFLSPVDASAAPKKLTEKNRATDTTPVFSPDGKTLAYLAMRRPGYESDRQYITLRSWPTGAERTLAESWDRSADGLAWSADGKTLFTTSDDVGQHPAFAIDVKSGQVKKITQPGHVTDPQPLPDGRVAYSLDAFTAPADLYVVKPGKSDAQQITHANAAALAKLRFGQAEFFEFQGAAGDTVHGYVMKPADYVAGQKYPVAFLIHGGPQGSYGNDFHYRWNPEIYAGHGYAVVAIDFHGSTGYGQKFTDAINGDWGGKPLEDLQKGLAAATQKYPFLAEDRVCALGASYGGYMINWIEGAWPERFKCLVNHDGNLDARMAYFDTDELWFDEWEHHGTPWEKPEEFAKHNPIDHVAQWKTPMMVVHGGKDFRVVETHGMGTFTALQRRNIPSKLLYFPDENHWVLKPANTLQWHQEVLGWLDRWTQPGGAKTGSAPSAPR